VRCSMYSLYSTVVVYLGVLFSPFLIVLFWFLQFLKVCSVPEKLNCAAAVSGEFCFSYFIKYDTNYMLLIQYSFLLGKLVFSHFDLIFF
jgi:hypothetical protein